MPIDQLSITFAALADPTRRTILARLSQGQAAVLDLAKPFNMTLPAVSKHLKVLEKAGLIERSRHARNGGRAHYEPGRCRMQLHGSRATASFGREVSIVSTTI